MQNRNRFPQQYMYAVVPVYYVNQGSIVDGNDTVLRNSDNPIEVYKYSDWDAV